MVFRHLLWQKNGKGKSVLHHISVLSYLSSPNSQRYQVAPTAQIPFQRPFLEMPFIAQVLCSKSLFIHFLLTLNLICPKRRLSIVEILQKIKSCGDRLNFLPGRLPTLRTWTIGAIHIVKWIQYIPIFSLPRCSLCLPTW